MFNMDVVKSESYLCKLLVEKTESELQMSDVVLSDDLGPAASRTDHTGFNKAC